MFNVHMFVHVRIPCSGFTTGELVVHWHALHSVAFRAGLAILALPAGHVEVWLK
jgi:hypothetical protein